MLGRWMALESLPFHVVGACMAPAISNGDQVQVRACRIYWPGDVVAFRSHSGTLWLHRVIGYRIRSFELHVVTKADRADIWDVSVGYDRVLGKVVGSPSGVESFRVSFRDRLGFFWCFFRLAWTRIFRKPR